MRPRAIFALLLAPACLSTLACARWEPGAVITVAPVNRAATPEVLARAREVLWDRLSFSLNSSAVRVRSGDRFLRIELQNAADAPRATRLATVVEALSFVDSDDVVAAGVSVPPESPVILSDSDFHFARLRKAHRNWNVEFFLNPEGAQRFAEYAEENGGRYLLVTQAGLVLTTSPVASPPIPAGYRLIARLESREMAELLIALLRTGPLPCELAVVPNLRRGSPGHASQLSGV